MELFFVFIGGMTIFHCWKLQRWHNLHKKTFILYVLFDHYYYHRVAEL